MMNRKQFHESYNKNMTEWERLDDMVDINNPLAIQESLEKRDGLVRQFVRQWNAVDANAQVKVVEDEDGLAVSWEIVK
jgi:hypothetical protein